MSNRLFLTLALSILLFPMSACYSTGDGGGNVPTGGSNDGGQQISDGGQQGTDSTTVSGGPSRSKKLTDLSQSEAMAACQTIRSYGDCVIGGDAGQLEISAPDDCQNAAMEVADVPDGCPLTVGQVYDCQQMCTEQACQPIFNPDCIATGN